MKTVADPEVVKQLLARFAKLSPESQRRWGTLTANEMLCHLADANDMALGLRASEGEILDRGRPFMKWLAFTSPLPWPKGFKTNPAHNPKERGTRPSEFPKDLERVADTLRKISQAAPGSMFRAHKFFGNMSVQEWQRWAYLHANHHLTQFGA